MNENRKKVSSVSKIRILAAAALSAAIIGSQVPIVQASETGVIQEIVNSIPENVTVENPVALSDIKLPDNEYGILEWADGSFIPDRRVQSCEAILKPADGVDLSDMEGWDEEISGVICYIRVVVSSIESSEDYASENGCEEKTSDTSEIPGEITSSDSENPDGISEYETDDRTPEDEPEDIRTEDKSSDNKEDKKADEGATLEKVTEADLSRGEVIKEEPSDKKELSLTEEQTSEEPEAKEDTEQLQGVLEEDVSGSSGNQSAPVENIFDNPADFTVEDGRPVQAEDDLSEEEQAERAMVNHSCNGIFVSGINLPWYVQFRVSSGESYEFSNEADAMIFQSYEFELWDLQNNTEYEIPDGEYISVTIPVKEGYDYIIEHLLDNGASETIIPSVEGSTMVFSTHSFSPFGIAGSKQLVGPDFEPDISITPTPTPTVTPAAKPSQTPGGSSMGTGTGINSGGSTGNGSGNSSSAVSGGNVSGGIASDDNNGSTGLSGSGGSSEGNNSQNYSDSSSGSTGENESVSDGSGNLRNSIQSTGNQSSTKNNAVATGDTTQILPFVILIVAAVVIIGSVFFIRKKK